MQKIRSAALSVLAVLASALPAAAQVAATGADTGNGTGTGGSLALVWGWILIAGIVIFIVGTSLGVRSGRK